MTPDDVAQTSSEGGEAEVEPKFMIGLEFLVEDPEFMAAVCTAVGRPPAAPDAPPPAFVDVEFEIESTRSLMDLRRVIRIIAPQLEYLGCSSVRVTVVERYKPDWVEQKYEVSIGKFVDALEPPPRENAVPSPRT